MNRWAGIAGVAVALGLVTQDVLAAGTGSRFSSPGSSSGGVQSSASGGNPPHHRHHRHPHPLPATVVVPAYGTWFWYYPPAFSYGLASPFYAMPPAFAGGSGYAPGTSEYWYFCPDSRQYYPYVRECASGWLAVVPGVAGPPN